MTVPGRDVFEVAARAPVVGMIESLGDHGPRPLAEIARYRRRGDQPAGRCVREDQIGWRSGLSRRTSSGAVAGEAGVVSNPRERLAVTGPTIVLQKGVSFRQWTARPLLVDLDHAVAAVGEEQGDRQHQAADQNREPERPGQTSPAEKPRLGREDRALVTARQRIPDFNGAGQCDDRLVSTPALKVRRSWPIITSADAPMSNSTSRRKWPATSKPCLPSASIRTRPAAVLESRA